MDLLCSFSESIYVKCELKQYFQKRISKPSSSHRKMIVASRQECICKTSSYSSHCVSQNRTCLSNMTQSGDVNLSHNVTIMACGRTWHFQFFTPSNRFDKQRSDLSHVDMISWLQLKWSSVIPAYHRTWHMFTCFKCTQSHSYTQDVPNRQQ